MFDINHSQIRNAVERALDEDIGSGDVTSELTIPELLRAEGKFVAKDDFVLAGVELWPLIYTIRGDLRGGASVHCYKRSGDSVQKGDTIAVVSAAARTLLECERVALHFGQ
jgi:nicotinate-nucleotide pyrophosphorylase (carboxylating)